MVKRMPRTALTCTCERASGTRPPSRQGLSWRGELCAFCKPCKSAVAWSQCRSPPRYRLQPWPAQCRLQHSLWPQPQSSFQSWAWHGSKASHGAWHRHWHWHRHRAWARRQGRPWNHHHPPQLWGAVKAGAACRPMVRACIPHQRPPRPPKRYHLQSCACSQVRSECFTQGWAERCAQSAQETSSPIAAPAHAAPRSPLMLFREVLACSAGQIHNPLQGLS